MTHGSSGAIAPALFHRTDPLIPERARAMLSDSHRTGCADRACTSPTHRGPVRATWYARVQQGSTVRALYLCTGCAKRFASTHGLTLGASHV